MCSAFYIEEKGEDDTARTQKEQEIRTKEEEIQSKEEAIKSKEEAMQSKEEAMKSNEETITRKEETIKSKEDTLKCKEEDLERKIDELKAIEEELAAEKKVASSLEEQTALLASLKEGLSVTTHMYIVYITARHNHCCGLGARMARNYTNPRVNLAGNN